MPANILTQTIEASQRGVPLPEMIQALDKAGAMGPVLASGLRCLQANPQATSEDIQAQMQTAGRLAAQGLERYLPALATIASAAPLLGLLGTVVGMIEIFGAHTAANNQPALLAHGISVALYNTAFGLIVAWMAFALTRSTTSSTTRNSATILPTSAKNHAPTATPTKCSTTSSTRTAPKIWAG